MLTLGEFSKIAALNVIICLEEDFTESRFADRIILQVEFIKAVKRV
jgi:hypothetical protein